MDTEIRPCQPQELPLVLSMSDALVAEGCCNGMVNDTLDDLAKENILVAVQGGQIIGYAYGRVAQAQRNRGRVRKGEAVFDIEEVYVRPDHRKEGVGKLLCEALLAQGRAAGCHAAQLVAVNKDYAALLRFYEQMGMEFWCATMTMPL